MRDPRVHAVSGCNYYSAVIGPISAQPCQACRLDSDAELVNLRLWGVKTRETQSDYRFLQLQSY